MRRIMIIGIIFSFLLHGCTSPFDSATKSVTERNLIAFDEWLIPGTFIPKDLYVVGLGDSLTQGVGDELKKEGYFGRLTHNEMINWKGVKDVHAENLAKRGRKSDQLIRQLEDPEIQASLKKADIILFTIGGNDLMKIIKRDLFKLKKSHFDDERTKFDARLAELFGMIRGLNTDAIIVAAGLYNPFTIVTDESTGFEDIIDDWNHAIEAQTEWDNRSCFIPVTDLFDSNTNMVYHTDFFHPNAKGYEEMTTRMIEEINKCGLSRLSDGRLDMERAG